MKNSLSREEHGQKFHTLSGMGLHAGSFAGIFKMAVRFDNKLNNLSTADFYTKSTKKAVKYYKLERAK